MHLTALALEEFRCYKTLALPLPPRGLVITGANGSGKTTILEAIAFLATARSPRAGLDREMIRWHSGEDLASAPFARVHGDVQTAESAITLDITLQLDSAAPGAAPMTRKQVRVNNIPRRAVDAVGTLRTVLFAPTDLDLITGTPSGRRRYLDIMLSQMDRRYIRALATYTSTLAQRNALLKRFAGENRNPNDPALHAELTYWDESLVAAGAYVHARRAVTVAALSAHAAASFATLTDGTHTLAIAHTASVPTPVGTMTLEEWEQMAARDFAQALHERRREELRRAVSVVGPHRDDIAIHYNDVELAAYGSRGQQRLAVLAIKLAEIAVMTEETGEPPVALLDDILSELDPAHRAFVLETVLADENRQVIITGADDGLLDRFTLQSLGRIVAEDGSVQPA